MSPRIGLWWWIPFVARSAPPLYVCLAALQVVPAAVRYYVELEQHHHPAGPLFAGPLCAIYLLIHSAAYCTLLTAL